MPPLIFYVFCDCMLINENLDKFRIMQLKANKSSKMETYTNKHTFFYLLANIYASKYTCSLVENTEVHTHTKGTYKYFCFSQSLY